jgi:aminopeptidase YwaD
MRKRFLFLPFLNIFLAQLVLAQLPLPLSTAYNSINHSQAYEFNRTLAKDFAGRLTGDTGYTQAATWVANQFHQWNIKPYNSNGTYLQPFAAPFTRFQSAAMTVQTRGSSDSISFLSRTLEIEKDFLPLLYSDSGSINAECVFAGWGICAPELQYDDYKNLNVRGKIVLCFRGTPVPNDSPFQHYDEHRVRMQTAKEKGAVALFYIYEHPIANPNGDHIAGFLSSIVSYKTAELILSEKGWKASALRDSLERTKHPFSFLTQTKVNYTIKAQYHSNGIGYNILGYIEGTDPKLKKECIIVGAHLDHCGTHAGITFAGANDNASGSAVVMTIAQACSKLKTPPKRSIVFALFGGEEMGLLGAKYLSKNIPSPFTSVKAMVNFDMVGEGDGAGCGYSADPAWLKAVIDYAGSTTHVIKEMNAIKHIGVSTSDFAEFYKEGIPCLSLYSNGPHLSYHQSGDTIYRINPDILADIARLGFLCAVTIAEL